MDILNSWQSHICLKCSWQYSVRTLQCVGSWAPGRLDDGGEFEVKCGTESVDKREIAKLT